MRTDKAVKRMHNALTEQIRQRPDKLDSLIERSRRTEPENTIGTQSKQLKDIGTCSLWYDLGIRRPCK